MIVLERLTQLYRQAVAALRGSGKLQAPSLASLQRSSREYIPGLAGRLAIATGLIVALAVGAMSVLSIGSLRRLADAEGLARVELAVSSAREGMRQSTEDLLTAAHILGERAALQRSLRGPMVETLPVLARYCETVALGACALVRDEAILATTSDEVDWDLVLAAAEEQGERFLVTGALQAVGARRARRRGSRSMPASRCSCCASSTRSSRCASRNGPASQSGSSTTLRSSPAKGRWQS